MQQAMQNVLLHLGQGAEGVQLVVEQLTRFLAVVERVVQFVGLQLVVLQQAVVGALGEQQRRQVERVDGLFVAQALNVGQISWCMMLCPHRYSASATNCANSVRDCVCSPSPRSMAAA